MAEDISDIYIKSSKDPLFNSSIVENNTTIDVILTKIQMILFTNKGEVISDPDFGADIPTFLWKTRFPASTIKADIEEQFSKYIPELSPGDYKINVYILPGSIQDIGVIQIDLGISNFSAVFK